jgi:hypothetical protein
MLTRNHALALALLISSGGAAAELDECHSDGAMIADDAPRTKPRSALARRVEEGSALLTRFGALFTIGGGFGDFVESDLTAATSGQGIWEARAVVGTRSPFALEAAYVGSAQAVDALGLRSNAGLISNGLEGALRLNVPISLRELADVDGRGAVPTLIEPYAFSGIGWKRYSLLHEGRNTSSVQQSDDILTLPLGVGLALALGGITLDGRFTYRHAFFSDLVGNETSSFGAASLSQWQLGASVGFEL